MKKEKKFLAFVLVFFACAFLIAFYTSFTIQKANKLFPFLVNEKLFASPRENLPQTYYGHELEFDFFKTQDHNKETDNFVTVTIHNVTPLMCSQILNRNRPFKSDVFLNDKAVFFGSDWRCFKKIKHTMRFQYEIGNYPLLSPMNTPKSCLEMWDCDYDQGETCRYGYCVKQKVPKTDEYTSLNTTEAKPSEAN